MLSKRSALVVVSSRLGVEAVLYCVVWTHVVAASLVFSI